MIENNALQFLETLKDEKRIINYAVKKTVCSLPFTMAKIYADGDVYTCCKKFIKYNKIGNIFENSLKDIWNGEKAQELRNKILSGDYSMCGRDLCTQAVYLDEDLLKNCRTPKHISLSYDAECNLNCIICRDEKFVNTQDRLKYYNEKIYPALEPVLKEAEEISLSSSGEALYSKHSRELIKKISAANPKILWNIKTNGLLFTSENCRALGIYGKINTVYISIHAMNKDVYDKIMRGSDYDTVIKNIKEAAYECNVNKTIKKVNLHAVISILNYKEIPALAEFARQNNISLSISQFYHGETKFGADYDKIAVWEKTHPEFENFKKILKHSALGYDKIAMTPRFKKIREME